MKISAQYRKVVRDLEAVSAEPEAEARELMAHAYGLPPGGLIMRFFDEAEHIEAVDQLTSARLTGRPLAYVIRERNFYGMDLYVDERVLIPRYDTESVAEDAINTVRAENIHRAADLCCGSGCIGLAILSNTDIDEVLFTDISDGALEVARLNAVRLGLNGRARFAKGDFLSAVPPDTELIVCNPPYISQEEFPLLESQVREYEPESALVAPEGGMYFYRRLALEAPSRLARGGTLIAETGDGQADAAAALFSDAGFYDIRIEKDLSGRPRFVHGRSAQ